MTAIMEDAMRIVLAPVTGPHRGGDRPRAVRWFASPDRSYVFSFERICEVLEWDPARVRGKLRVRQEQGQLRTPSATTRAA
jgi:hypothetical protein